MDIHKPKPVRNWREFLKELGTIALGVSIALAAEQTVEWAHWRSEVATARSALAQEITNNNRNFFALRIAIQPCLLRQIREADAILNALETGHEPDKFTAFRVGARAVFLQNEWQSQRASQVLTHFPHAELGAMGRYYAVVEDTNTMLGQESDAWQALSILQHPPHGIPVSDLIRLRTDLGTAQRLGSLIVLQARRQLRISTRLGIADVQANAERAKAFCTMNSEDYGNYLASRNPNY